MLYKIESKSISYPVIYVKADSLEDALYKARKYYESTDSALNNELYKLIHRIELISKKLVE